jgi:hypothetical protein
MLDTMNRALVVIGILIVLIGIFWRQISALPFFRLPGDLVFDRPGFKVFFPITTMIVVSVVVSLILWLFRR